MSSNRPFRFGVTGARFGASAQQWRDFARQAEDLGYSSVLMPDHLGPQLSPLPALVAAATATTRLRVGTLVLDNDFRHPAVLAKEAATLDLLTEGRFELGLGAGWKDDEYRAMGLPFDAADERVSRLAEAVQLIKRALAGESVTLNGAHYQTHELVVEPRPMQQPLPLLIGGGRPRMLRLAAQEATIVGLMDAPRAGTSASEHLAREVQTVREAAGGRYEQLELSIFAARVEVDNAPEGARAMPYGMSSGPEDDSPWAMVGSRDSIVERLQAQREQFDISYICVFGPAMERFAPIVAQLSGT